MTKTNIVGLGIGAVITAIFCFFLSTFLADDPTKTLPQVFLSLLMLFGVPCAGFSYVVLKNRPKHVYVWITCFMVLFGLFFAWDIWMWLEAAKRLHSA